MIPDRRSVPGNLDKKIAAAPKRVPTMTDRKAERETIIYIGYAADGTQVVAIYTTQRAIWRKAERAGWQETMRDGGGREYEAPAGQFRFSLRSDESTRNEHARRAEAIRTRGAAKAPVTVGKSDPGEANGHGAG